MAEWFKAAVLKTYKWYFRQLRIFPSNVDIFHTGLIKKHFSAFVPSRTKTHQDGFRLPLFATWREA